VTESFLKQHPDIVLRFLKTYLSAAQWISDEKNREAYFEICAKTGTPIENVREDSADKKLIESSSPLIDEFVRTHYKTTKDLCLQLGLIENDFDINSFIDDNLLQQALKETGLESYWSYFDAEGYAAPK
jgi:sulfonate transport system substrate-binding protein